MAGNKKYYTNNFFNNYIKYIVDKEHLDIGKSKSGIFFFGVSPKDDEIRFIRKIASSFNEKEGKMKTVSLSKDGSFEADEFDY